MEELVLTLVRLYAPGQSALHPDLVRHGHAMEISWGISCRQAHAGSQHSPFVGGWGRSFVVPVLVPVLGYVPGPVLEPVPGPVPEPVLELVLQTVSFQFHSSCIPVANQLQTQLQTSR